MKRFRAKLIMFIAALLCFSTAFVFSACGGKISKIIMPAQTAVPAGVESVLCSAESVDEDGNKFFGSDMGETVYITVNINRSYEIGTLKVLSNDKELTLSQVLNDSTSYVYQLKLSAAEERITFSGVATKKKIDVSADVDKTDDTGEKDEFIISIEGNDEATSVEAAECASVDELKNNLERYSGTFVSGASFKITTTHVGNDIAFVPDNFISVYPGVWGESPELKITSEVGDGRQTKTFEITANGCLSVQIREDFYRSRTRTFEALKSNSFSGELFSVSSSTGTPIFISTYEQLYSEDCVLMRIGDNKVVNKIIDMGFKTVTINGKEETLNLVTIGGKKYALLKMPNYYNARLSHEYKVDFTSDVSEFILSHSETFSKSQLEVNCAYTKWQTINHMKRADEIYFITDSNGEVAYRLRGDKKTVILSFDETVENITVIINDSKQLLIPVYTNSDVTVEFATLYAYYEGSGYFGGSSIGDSGIMETHELVLDEGAFGTEIVKIEIR